MRPLAFLKELAVMLKCELTASMRRAPGRTNLLNCENAQKLFDEMTSLLTKLIRALFVVEFSAAIQ